MPFDTMHVLKYILKAAFTIIAVVVFSTETPGQIINLRTLESYVSLQAAIDESTDGDTITVGAATYSLTGHLSINKGISVIGADEQTTIIDASGNSTDYGILLSASGITLKNFTILPPLVPGSLGTSGGGGYAIHVLSTPSSNLLISNITVKDGNRTGIDIQGADDVVLTNITSMNAAYGNGVTLTGVVNATLSNITTSGNDWGGIAIYTSTARSRGSDSITIYTESSSINEQNKIYVQDSESLTSTNINVAGYDYVINNHLNSLSSLYTWYQESLPEAVSYALKIDSTWSGSFITKLSTGEKYVGQGMKIQPSVNASVAGGIVNISSGTYNDTLLINKRISLFGAGSDTDGTIIQSITPPVVTGGATYPSGYRPVIRLNASGEPGDSIVFKDLRIRPRQDIVGAAYPHPGILFEPNSDISYIKLENVNIAGTSSVGTPEMGIVADGSTSINHFAITNSEFSDMGYGLIFFNDVNSSTTFRNFNMYNCRLEKNSLKGFYAEKLSDAVFNYITVTDNGDTSKSPVWADANNAGIDINLKNGTYQNLSFTNITFTNNGIGSSNGSALTIKARGTGTDSYSSTPAIVNDVVITNSLFDNNVISVSIGESGKGNTGPGNILINKNSFSNSSFAVADQRDASADTIDATGNWWNSEEGPDDNAVDGTASYNISTGEKIYELFDKKITYAPWYSVNPDDNITSAGVNRLSPKVLWVEESVPYKSKGYINQAIKLASTTYVDTISVQIETITEIPVIDKKVVIKFAHNPVLDSLDISSGDLELPGNITISGGLNLSGGNIRTGNSKLIFDTSAGIPVETTSARIIGTVQILPRNIGTGSFNLLGLQINAGIDNLGNISFTRKSGDNAVVNVEGNEGIGMTWDIEVDNQPGGGREVIFSWLSSFDNGIDPSNIIVYRNTGSGWQYYAGPLNASGNPRQVTVPVTGFSSWTIGGAEEPLPVELVSFKALATDNKIELTWGTATEVNNYGFEVERLIRDSEGQETFGTDHKSSESWNTIGFVRGYGNSNSWKSYSFIDNNHFNDHDQNVILMYRLKQVDIDGSYEYSNIIELSIRDVPVEFDLAQNYPNPFNATTKISYTIPEIKESETINVELIVYDILGREMFTLVNEKKKPGKYSVEFDASYLSAGIYIYNLTAGTYSSTKKLIFLK